MKHSRRLLARRPRATRRQGLTRRPMLRIHHIHEVFQSGRYPMMAV